MRLRVVSPFRPEKRAERDYRCPVPESVLPEAHAACEYCNPRSSYTGMLLPYWFGESPWATTARDLSSNSYQTSNNSYNYFKIRLTNPQGDK